MSRLLIIGAGGHGRVVCDAASLTHRYSEIAFLDDRFGSMDDPFPDHPLIGRASDAFALSRETEFIVAIGNNGIRERVMDQLAQAGLTLATVIHPAAVIGRSVTVREGTVIMAGAVVQTGAHIGRGCILNTASSVDHDDVIGDFTHISVGAHLCGTVTVGKGCFVCTGSTVINNINVCGGTILGAGSVTVCDITEPGTYVGVPARRIR